MIKSIIITLSLYLAVLSMQAQLSPQYIAMEQHLECLRQPANVGEYDAAISYVDDQLDFTLLATSPHWESTIRLWVAAHEALSLSPNVFEVQLAIAAKKIIARTLPDMGTAERLVRTIHPLMQAKDMTSSMPSLAAACYGIDVPLDETSALATRMLTAILLINDKAPSLAYREHDKLQNCLLLFFDSNCDGCQQMVKLLTTHYTALQQKGIRVVSIAADLSPQSFKANNTRLPWYNYCTYRGFKDDNFVLYGVASVPVLYYIDNGGTIRGKYYKVQDVEKEISQWTAQKGNK